MQLLLQARRSFNKQLMLGRVPIRQGNFLGRNAQQGLWAKPNRSMFRAYSSMPQPEVKSSSKYKKRYIILGSGLTALAILYAGSDDFRIGLKHSWYAYRRVSTVTVACVRCFYRYYRTLNGKYDSEEEYEAAMLACHKTCALITRKAIESNGGIYIKLGQHISALTYIFPREWTETMIPLQDRCPTSSYEMVSQLIESDTGHSMDELFESFEHEPLGTASLAQVHSAKLKNSHQQVAVKVQHPSLVEFVPLDILMTKTVFNLIDYLFPQYPLTWLSEELQQSIYVELDFRQEAENALKTKEYFSNVYAETALRVPMVYEAEKRVLVMEYVTGGRPDDLEYLRQHNISTSEVSSCFARIFNDMVFTPGVGLHCDPHPGNIAVRPLGDEEKKAKHAKHNFEIILYDHGLYRDVPTNIRRAYAHFWLALINGNEDDMRKYAKKFANISDDDYKLFAAAITGRDFENATNIERGRSQDEILNMAGALQEDGFISQIVQMLHKLPRIVLLILKTNDLTRNLDEKLDSPLGVKRSFLIMAVYCARTVFDEQAENIRNRYQHSWSLIRIALEFKNWWSFFVIRARLSLYDTGLWLQGAL